MSALPETQRAFAAHLRGGAASADEWVAGDGFTAEARLGVYRNNVRAVFEQALEATYPVVRARVGPDYFRQLTHFYGQAHPSGSGDLHEVGRSFAGFLRGHLTGSPYEWLADLATLEWAIAEAGVAADANAATAAALAAVAPESVGGTRLLLAPSLQRIAAPVPVVSVWRANQPGAAAAAVDLAAGPEFVLVHRGADGVQLSALPAAEFAFVDAIARGATLEAALESSGLPLESLPALLHALFDDAVVAEIIPPRSAACLSRPLSPG